MVLVVLCAFLYLNFDFNRNLDKEAFESAVSEIQQTEKLPEAFINMYTQIHPITNTNSIFYHGIMNKRDRRCPCLHMTKLVYWPSTKNFGKLKVQTSQYFYAKKLEKRVSQQECLNAYTNRFDFLFKKIGIYNASRYYFDKELATLNEDEMITLVLMLKNPRHYNPKRSVSQKTLATKIARIKEKLSSQKNE
ncbi:MAG: hypothetical protein ACI9Y7_002384 [Dokdonia sp.]|jgi:hypothetical protein